jgi:hypothetical protein
VRLEAERSFIAHALYTRHGHLGKVSSKGIKRWILATPLFQTVKAPHLLVCRRRDLIFDVDAADINLVIDLLSLSLFGNASGLHTNLQKSSVVPIWCDDQIIAAAKELLYCKFADFPCKYLGSPLSIKKLTRAQIQTIIDKVDSSLPDWIAELMNRAWRAVHSQFVMAAKVIYSAIVVDLPLWAVKAIEKILRGFLSKGRKEAKGVTAC